MKTTLFDLLHAINIIGIDTDILVDGIETITVCPPIKFTPEALSQFRMALSAYVKVEYGNYSHSCTYVCDSDEDVNIEAWRLLSSFAGYCNADKFSKWFEGDNAKLI